MPTDFASQKKTILVGEELEQGLWSHKEGKRCELGQQLWTGEGRRDPCIGEMTSFLIKLM